VPSQKRERFLHNLRISLQGFKEGSSATNPTLDVGDLELLGVLLVGDLAIGDQHAAGTFKQTQRGTHRSLPREGKKRKHTSSRSA
jgi:hypothetical protein